MFLEENFTHQKRRENFWKKWGWSTLKKRGGDQMGEGDFERGVKTS